MSDFHLDSLLVGLHTLKANPLRTMLSTLGVIIGVAALVSVLSLGDSLEAFSRRQIEETTDLLSVTLAPRTTERVNGILVPHRSAAAFQADDVSAIGSLIDGLGDATLTLTRSNWTRLEGEPGVHSESPELATLIVATLPDALALEGTALAAGRFLAWTDFEAADRVAVLSHAAAEILAPGAPANSLLGRRLDSGESIVGVLEPTARPRPPTVLVPLDTVNRSHLADSEHAPLIRMRVEKIENVSAVVDAVNAWVDEQEEFDREDVTVASSTERVLQTAQAMSVFKLALGSIAGISLLVGGIGIMNILLASVTERTREIGIRRATGARRRHIFFQFLSESVAISVVGSVMGAAIGVGATYGITFAIEALTKAPLPARFSPGSLLLSALVAIVIGLAFGTYPARRASRIEPAVAMRYE